jgi:WS/DGAT/MGAT family acyltransferase
MHVGWAAVFDPPRDAARPTFAQLRDHIHGHLSRAPRYRQRLYGVPLGLHAPVWADDDRFDITRHVLHARFGNLDDLVCAAMSVPLERDRPLWESWIADRLDDGRIAVVGKVHHCLADGLAAVELGSVLLDPTPDPPPIEPDGWRPAPPPSPAERAIQAMVDRARENFTLLEAPARLASSPLRVANEGTRLIGALTRSLYPPAQPNPTLNESISPLRQLARLHRPIEELLQIKQRHSVSLNDVVLAACAGGIRAFLRARGEVPTPLKTMVPVNVRSENEKLGNRITFMFVTLPCDQADPLARLRAVNKATSERKRSGESKLTDAALSAAAFAPRPVQRALTRIISSPRTFNLVISNIPGPRVPLWMRGCELREAYPVVPLADEHALSIGVTTVRDGAFFGLYADRKSLPDVHVLAARIDDAIDELLGRSRPRQRPSRRYERRPTPTPPGLVHA